MIRPNAPIIHLPEQALPRPETAARLVRAIKLIEAILARSSEAKDRSVNSAKEGS